MQGKELLDRLIADGFGRAPSVADVASWFGQDPEQWPDSLFYEYLFGSLSADQHALVDQHVGRNEKVRARLEAVRAALANRDPGSWERMTLRH